jgi:hypothetical protein
MAGSIMTTITTHTLLSTNYMGNKSSVKFVTYSIGNALSTLVDITYANAGLPLMSMQIPNSSWSLSEGESSWTIDGARKIWDALISAGWKVSP